MSMICRSIFQLVACVFIIVTCVAASDAQPSSDSVVASDTAAATESKAKPAAESKERHFKFAYEAQVVDVPLQAQVRIWVPIANSNRQQTVRLEAVSAAGSMSSAKDATYGNEIGYVESTQVGDQPIEIQLKYDVHRQEATADGVAQLEDLQKRKFLAANRLVPTTGQPTELLQGNLPQEPTAAGQRLYELVENHMKYDKSQPGYGNGDSTWACNSKTGNCTDFHSLFISLARSQNLPARFEIGFPLPADKTEGDIGGYHCWAWFFAAGQGWMPVDISEADKHPDMKDYYFGRLTPDRIAFSTGRDIQLVPASVAPPLNYFVYPHVEVDGKVWPRDKVNLHFSFHDVDAADEKTQ